MIHAAQHHLQLPIRQPHQFVESKHQILHLTGRIRVFVVHLCQNAANNARILNVVQHLRGKSRVGPAFSQRLAQRLHQCPFIPTQPPFQNLHILCGNQVNHLGFNRLRQPPHNLRGLLRCAAHHHKSKHIGHAQRHPF